MGPVKGAFFSSDFQLGFPEWGCLIPLKFPYFSEGHAHRLVLIVETNFTQPKISSSISLYRQASIIGKLLKAFKFRTFHLTINCILI
jgi:hypothetical protein